MYARQAIDPFDAAIDWVGAVEHNWALHTEIVLWHSSLPECLPMDGPCLLKSQSARERYKPLQGV
jgi:hypothetical protein